MIDLINIYMTISLEDSLRFLVSSFIFSSTDNSSMGSVVEGVVVVVVP